MQCIFYCNKELFAKILSLEVMYWVPVYHAVVPAPQGIPSAGPVFVCVGLATFQGRCTGEFLAQVYCNWPHSPQ